METRTLQTLFGVDVTFRRRRYVDRTTGQSVFLLDQALKLPEQQQVTPALTSWVLGQAVLSGAYRGAARSLKALYGHQVRSHESVRQVVLARGIGPRGGQARRRRPRRGRRQLRILCREVDGLGGPLERSDGAKRVEEKRLTVHEGWRRRYPGSDSAEYELVNKRHYRTQARDFWDPASRFVYSLYDIDEDTVVVINGDRAGWIRQGVNYFPNAV